VDRGNGYLEPREVETGDRTGERLEIVKGLAAGERVVTSGNFLIDSESQLKPAPAGERSGGAHHD
jgi:multidrug efflux pump subunit AcrA (membrane-fusion protein)